MEVTVQRSCILTLDKLANNDTRAPVEIPLDIFDRFASNIHIAVIYAFSPPTPTNTEIIEALSKTLHSFPTLVGELGRSNSGRPCVIIGGKGGGALLVEATVASKLEDYLPLEPSPDFALLHPPAAKEKECKLLQIQLNRFACGGLVIGVTAHHRVADGQSMSTFFVAWGKTVRDIPFCSLPVFSDKPWLKPREPPRCEFEHWGFEFIPVLPHPQNGFTVDKIEEDPDKITNVLLHYSSEYLSKLKASIPEKYTTFETLLGHLWRKITISRGLHGEEFTRIRVSVNGRPRLKPPVPHEFFGNLVLNAYPKAKVHELIEGGTKTAARIVHEAVRMIDDAYFKSFIDFGYMHEELELKPCYDEEGNVLSPNLEVDSWLGFPFQEVGFGGGGALRGFTPSWVPIDGILIFLPTLRQDGGVDVVVTLRVEHARLLRNISHSLAK